MKFDVFIGIAKFNSNFRINTKINFNDKDFSMSFMKVSSVGFYLISQSKRLGKDKLKLKTTNRFADQH